MARRYYLAPVIGDGSEINPFRAKVEDYNVSYVSVIPTHPIGHPDAGKPIHSWCLVLVNTIDHRMLLQDSELDALPDFPKDAKVSAMHQATKTAMRNALTRKGIPTTVSDNADGYREVIRGIGKYLDTAFHEDNFDVSDVSN